MPDFHQDSLCPSPSVVARKTKIRRAGAAGAINHLSPMWRTCFGHAAMSHHRKTQTFGDCLKTQIALPSQKVWVFRGGVTDSPETAW